MRVSAKFSSICARVVLFTLVGIHFVLPFTPANKHEEQRIVIGSLILGVTFLTLGLVSFKRPFPSFAVSLAVLVAVYALSASTGASPLREGIIVKMFFAAGLVCGLLGAKTVPLSMIGRPNPRASSTQDPD